MRASSLGPRVKVPATRVGCEFPATRSRTDAIGLGVLLDMYVHIRELAK